MVPQLLFRLSRRTPSLFVISSGRTGTKGVVALLAQSPRILSLHEPTPTGVEEAKRAYLDGLEGGRYAEFLRRARGQRLFYARVTGRSYAEATNMIYLAPLIAEELPGSRFLFLHRHPGEVVRSGMRRGWYERHPWDPYRITPRPDDPAHAQWPEWDPFEKICWFWHAANRYILDFVASLDPQRVMVLSFEDYTGGDLESKRALFRFAGQEPPADDRLTSVVSLKVNAQHTGDFPKYAEWTDAQRDTLRRIAGPTMERLGYA